MAANKGGDYNVLNSFYPGLPAQPGVNALLGAVLVQDGEGKMRVYVGLVNRREASGGDTGRRATDQWIAAHGDKQTYQKALGYFPRLQEANYNE
jgi:hypothetical protein